MNANTKLAKYIKESTYQRFLKYENEDEDYGYTITLQFANSVMPEIKIAILETGAENFLQKFDQAMDQAKSLQASHILIKEYEDPGLASPAERAEMRQTIPFDMNAPKPAAKARKVKETGLGMAEVQNLVTEGLKEGMAAIEREKLIIQHEREVEKKDRQINELSAETRKLENDINTLKTQLAAKEKEIEDLFDEVETEKQNKWNVNQIPFGRILGDAALHLAVKKPEILGFLGIPPEAVQGLLQSNETSEPGEAAPAPANDEKSRILDAILQYAAGLNDEEFAQFVNIVYQLQTNPANLQSVYELVTPAQQHRSS